MDVQVIHQCLDAQEDIATSRSRTRQSLVLKLVQVEYVDVITAANVVRVIAVAIVDDTLRISTGGWLLVLCERLGIRCRVCLPGGSDGDVLPVACFVNHGYRLL